LFRAAYNFATKHQLGHEAYEKLFQELEKSLKAYR